MLCANDFSGTDTTFSDHEDPRHHISDTMISTAVPIPQMRTEFPHIVVVVAEASEIQYRIAHQIQIQLGSMGIAEYKVTNTHEALQPLSEQQFCVFLPEIESSFLHSMNEEEFTLVKCLLGSGKGSLWVTQGGGQSPNRPEADIIVGIARTIRSEDSSRRPIVLTFQDVTDTIAVAQKITRVIEDTFDKPPELCEAEYEVVDDQLCINRIVEADHLNHHVFSKTVPQAATMQRFGNERALTLSVGSPGFLNTMQYAEDLRFEIPLGIGQVEIKVEAIGINFKDVLIALGRLSEGGLGNEAAGIVTRAGPEADVVPGDRVCVCALGTYKTYIRTNSMTVFKIPDSMPFCEAASLPVVYITAYQALFGIARITAGDSILIQSGAGGTGQAAIQLASLAGAKVYVTVGSEDKKKLVKDLYAIPDEQIFSSRGLSFTKGIKRVTNGRGVDIILNSLAGDSLQGSWDCLAPFGRFIEIGKKDILGRNKLPMLPFNENRTFAAINMTHMLSERPDLIRKTMEIVLKLVKDNKIGTPQPLHIYNNSEIEKSFRYLQGGKNTGKTVLEINDNDIVPVSSSLGSISDSN